MFITGSQTGTGTEKTYDCIYLSSTDCPTSQTTNQYADVKMEAEIPTDTSPSSVQWYLNGVAQSSYMWNIAATGWSYVIDMGSLPVGTNYVHTVVTFADGHTTSGGTLTVTVKSIQTPSGGS